MEIQTLQTPARPALPSLWCYTKRMDVGGSSLPSSLRPGYFKQLLDRGAPRQHLAQTILEHRLHPAFAGQAKILGRARAPDNRIVKTLIEDHQLEDGLPSAVTGLLALRATRALPHLERRVRGRLDLEFGEDRGRVRNRSLAVGANGAHQSLGQHRHQAGGEQIGLDTHV